MQSFIRYLPVFLFVLHFCILPVLNVPMVHGIYGQFDLNTWVNSTVEFLQNLNCDDSFLTSEIDCKNLISIEKSAMNLYIAEPTRKGRLMTVLPDGLLGGRATHDSILVLDPYPNRTMGHLLIVFFVDFYSEFQCKLNGGKYIGDSTCLSLALKKRCHNLLLEAKWKFKYLSKQHRMKYCEINFFPLVYVAGDNPSQSDNRLTCREDFKGFAKCPTLRSKDKTDVLLCDPLQLNTKRCSTTHESVGGTRCRLFQRCDYAVILGGGFNHLTSKPQFKENVLAIRDMLKENGFPDENIKTFYANGDNSESLFPSAFKATMRYHLQRLCKSPNCGDSLVIYLSSPTRNDGSSLLWDIDGNGIADENEIYTVRELAHDIENCLTSQVYIIADQGHTGKLIQIFENSHRHKNVQIFTSGDENSSNGEYTKLWRNFKHANSCVEEVHRVAQLSMASSKPLMFDGSNGEISKTIFGAPCNVGGPPLTYRELQKDYYGCQNLPSAVWMNWKRRNQQDEEE